MIAAPRWRLTAIGLLAAALTGCGGPYDATVAGVVTLDGATVTRGTISFTPQAGGPPAYGMIASDGKYSLRTGREEGVKSGGYTVTVAANEESNQQGRDGGPPPVGKPITPDWYRSPTSSGLSYEIKPGDNEINIELTKTPPPGWKAPPGRR